MFKHSQHSCTKLSKSIQGEIVKYRHKDSWWLVNVTPDNIKVGLLSKMIIL